MLGFFLAGHVSCCSANAVQVQWKVLHCLKWEGRVLFTVNLSTVAGGKQNKMGLVRKLTAGVTKEKYRDQPTRNLRKSTLEITGKVHNHYGLDPANHLSKRLTTST